MHHETHSPNFHHTCISVVLFVLMATQMENKESRMIQQFLQVHIQEKQKCLTLSQSSQQHYVLTVKNMHELVKAEETVYPYSGVLLICILNGDYMVSHNKVVKTEVNHYDLYRQAAARRKP